MKDALEIERVWLLRGLPPMPSHRQTLQLDQGYLVADDGTAQGRVRRTVFASGVNEFHFNIKSGSGLIRHEREESMSAAAFEQAWMRTDGRRLRKLRHRVCDGDLTFEIDQFLDFALVLAEVELPAADHRVLLPTWLDGWVLREVTDDVRYRNFNLAVHGAPAPTGG
ncbi:MAG: hypothetical protein EXS17_04975 [Phycisphaerales bacterium]|nr:hypothetical protein [Phycisphaerales bacterium]